VFDQVSTPRRVEEGDGVQKTLNISFNRYSNDLVTITDPMKLNKRHIHSTCSTAIPTMLCYTRCIIRCNVSCLFHREESSK
jgi:hypothetical protein